MEIIINNNIKIMCINKGNYQLNNKIDQLNHLILTHKPDIFSVNKLNLDSSDSVSAHQFPGYKMEIDNLYETDGCAHTGVLVKKFWYNLYITNLKDQGYLTQPLLPARMPG